MFGWYRRQYGVVKCGNCRGCGDCSRCRGHGILDKEERGNITIIGAMQCRRCGGNGVCTACGGSGWILPPKPEKHD